MPLQLVTPPIDEPVTLAEAKLHLRVDFDEDDALILALISAARQAAETITGRQFITARWKMVLDRFAGQEGMVNSCDSNFSLPNHAILLFKCPVQTITAIEYLDMNGAMQTMPPAHYVLETACEPARVTPVFGQIWPVSFKSWIKIRVGSLYAHREELSVINRGRVDPLPFIDGLLDSYKVPFI